MKNNLVRLDHLFRIRHGNKFDLNKMKKTTPKGEAIAFVGRSGEENGIVAFVERKKKIEPYPAGYITVALGGLALSSFVQPREFYTGQNIDVLEPLLEMSFDSKMYYCLCIEANRFRYSTFGREANRTLKTLLVPEISPEWVEGVANKSLSEIKGDLMNVLRFS